jgi:hypothetical protein
MDRTRRITPAGPARWLVVSALLALAGCVSDPVTRVSDDPLVGGSPIPSGNAPLTGTARGVLAYDSPEAKEPTLPPPQGPTSPAALTSGAPAAPAPATDKPVASTPPAGPAPKLQGPRPAAPESSARLTPVAAPAPAADPAVRPASAVVVTPAVVTPAAPAASASYEQLQQMLEKRGVTWQQLKTGAKKDEWQFTCSIPRAGQSNLERQYEVSAVGPYGLAAIRAVIAEIDKDQAGK